MQEKTLKLPNCFEEFFYTEDVLIIDKTYIPNLEQFFSQKYIFF